MGHDRLTDEAARWASELPKLFRKASPTKRFIVTSRAGVHHEAFGPNPIAGFSDTEFQLRPDHYSDEQRREIMRLRMLKAQPWQRDWVSRFESAWIEKLDIPLAIDHFAAEVIKAPSESALNLANALHASNVEMLAGAFAADITARGSEMVAGAFLVWAVHLADAHVREDSARQARTTTIGGGFTGAMDPERTLLVYIAAGWFRPSRSGFTAHPTALSGIESLLGPHGATADQVLGAFLLGLINARQVERAFAIVRRLELRPSVVSAEVRKKIESYLLSRCLTGEGYEVREAMEHLTQYALSDDPPLALVRALKPTSGKGVLSAIEHWVDPGLNPDAIIRISASVEAQAMALAFVTQVLPSDTWVFYSAAEIIRFLGQFGWNFAAELSSRAYNVLVEYNRNIRFETIVEAAILSGATNLPSLTDAVLVAEDVAADVWENNAEDRVKAAQCELDEEYSTHLDEEASELFQPLARARDDIVAARRTTQGWQWIPTYPRFARLLDSWAAAIDTNATSEELDAIERSCAHARMPYWQALANTKNLTHLSKLVAETGSASLQQIRECVKATAKLATDDAWNNEVMPALKILPLPARAHLSRIDTRAEDEAKRLASLATLVDDTEKTVLAICGSAGKQQKWSGEITDAHFDALRILARADETYLRTTATIALAYFREDVAPLLKQLQASDDELERQAGLFAAYASGQDVKAISLAALKDEDYTVRRLALSLLADCIEATWPSILPLADDPSAPVRDALAAIIGQMQFVAGVPVLFKLLKDRRDRRGSSLTNGSWPEFHVARAAARALHKFELGPERSHPVRGVPRLSD